MLNGFAAHRGSVDESSVVTIEIGDFKHGARCLADRAMSSRNLSVSHLNLIGGIPSQKQRAILDLPDHTSGQAGNRN